MEFKNPAKYFSVVVILAWHRRVVRIAENIK
jgi:hypothetical protein